MRACAEWLGHLWEACETSPMTAVTRLESLLLLLTSPQSKTQPPRQSDHLADRFPATDCCGSSSPLHGCSGQQAEALHIVATCGDPQRKSSGAHSPSDAQSKPLTEQDINAGASPDMLCRGRPAPCEGVAADCTQQPAHPAAAHEGGTACRQLSIAATPRPRQTDARAVPTAKHPAPTAWHSVRHGDGSMCDNQHHDAISAAASPGERRRWEQRVGAALQRTQV